MTTDLEPLLLRPDEACRMLACSDSHLRTLVAKGAVECRYDGTRRRIVMASVKAYVASLPEDPAGAA